MEEEFRKTVQVTKLSRARLSLMLAPALVFFVTLLFTLPTKSHAESLMFAMVFTMCLAPLSLALLFGSSKRGSAPGLVDVWTSPGALHLGDRTLTREDVDSVEVDTFEPIVIVRLPGERLKLYDVPRDVGERIRDLLAPEPRPLVACRTFALRGRARVTIGSDGVLIVTRHARSRFIPRARIKKLDASALVLVESEAISLRPAKRREGPALRCAILDMLSGESEDDAAIAEPAKLAGASPTAWIGALRGEGGGEGSYRVAAVDDVTYWRVAENPSASAEQRAAAVIAITSSDEARKRIRVIGGAVAAPELRAVFDAVAEDDEASLEKAVSSLRGSKN